MKFLDSILGKTQSAKNVFEKFASNSNGEHAMTLADFSKSIDLTKLKLNNESSVELLFKAADINSTGQLSLNDFTDFYLVLESSDAEYQILSRLVGKTGVTNLTTDQIKQFFGKSSLGVDFNSDAIKLALGQGSKPVSVHEFSEFVKILRQERLKAYFKKHDVKQTGIIPSDLALNLLTTWGGYKPTSTIANNFKAASTSVTFVELVALNQVLSRLDTVKHLIGDMNDKGITVTVESFSISAKNYLNYDSFTPLEIDVLFRLVGSNRDASVAFAPLFNPSYEPSGDAHHVVRLSAAMEVAKSVYNFALGSIAGAIGAAAVYPIDLVKTRMQNQRSSVVGQVLYKNGIDCFKKVVKMEGVAGLYSGLIPQLVGVAPEKAIKLTMNDLVRSRLKDDNGKTPLWAEILAGMTAGGSQVLFTNPLEIVKIRLQVQGEVAKAGIEGAAARMSAIGIVRQLGLLGLYKGVGACLLRDIPFSGIFFPVYAHIKRDLFREGVDGHKLTIPELLASGAIAGMPAAYLVTPADVIKTRLQVQARQGQTTYHGITDAFYKIMKEEGPKAFFKGGVARILRSSPQFGVTLASYEVLQKYLAVDFGDNPIQTSNGPVKLTNAEIGTRNSLRLLGELSLR
ncbi:mitochondrial aspartate-glutamate transporter agc1 [Terramyces sp. JEL0728]|nr:mitochondrial aspartate-glutamate transporter agc1 [Terramyces sp. JEL0728]